MPDPGAVSWPSVLLAALVVSAWTLGAGGAPASAFDKASPTNERQRIQVGPNRAVKTIGAAASLARDGALVEVDAGDYRGDTAVWTQNDVSLRAVGGRARLIADGMSAEAKGIWVVRAERMTVEGFDFTGAVVPDHNGAGIRLDQGSLHVRDCTFTYNEYGILTGNLSDTVLEVEDSEFGHSGSKHSNSHSLYAGTISRLSVSGSYFHHGLRGHLLKSRAAVNHIVYNRLTDEADGNASYELEFPNGGVSYVIGNIIQQSSLTENNHLISVGAEGYKWPVNALYLVNNTLIDNVPRGGVFLRVSPGADMVRVVNNLLVGKATWDIGVAAVFRNNPLADSSDFADLAAGDFRLDAVSRPLGKAADSGSANGRSLMPVREYRHRNHTAKLDVHPIHPGAIQTLKPKR